MDNAFDTMREALAQARQAQAAADNYANGMANMLRGRLRHVSGGVLADLKKELRDFNIRTGEWKD